MRIKWEHRDAVKFAAFRAYDAAPARFGRYGSRETFAQEAVSQAEELGMAHTMNFGRLSIAEIGLHLPEDFRFVAAEICQLEGEPVTTLAASTMKFSRGDVIGLTAAPRVTFAAGQATGPREFRGVAYSGAPIRFGGESLLVVDLAGMSIPSSGKIPILRQHSYDRPVGFAVAKVVDGRLEVEGTLTAANESGREAAELSDEGFPWRLSIGFSVLETARIAAGESKSVNGRNVQGPAVVVSKSRLDEASFVPVPADADTANAVEILKAA